MKESNEDFSFERISKNNDIKNTWKLEKDKLIFEGEYKKGKLNGKAKEYYCISCWYSRHELFQYNF